MAVNASEQTAPVFRVHGVRYQIRDVPRAVAFYTQQLGFELKHQQGEAFAAVGDVDVLLSGPGSSGGVRSRTPNNSSLAGESPRASGACRLLGWKSAHAREA